jgi:hypothetical protein
MNTSFIETTSQWGYEIYVPYIQGGHYLVKRLYSKNDGVLDYFLEESILTFDAPDNRTKENTRILHPTIVSIIIIGGIGGGILLIAVVIHLRRRNGAPGGGRTRGLLLSQLN